MSLSWVRAGLVFYNHSSANERSANERVPATIWGPSQCPSDYLCMPYEVNGKAVIHNAAALHSLIPHSEPIPITLNVFPT